MLSRIGLFLLANFSVLAVLSVSARVLGLDRWLAEQGIQHVTLHATEAGRPLYEQLGFVEGNEMTLHTNKQMPRTL